MCVSAEFTPINSTMRRRGTGWQRGWSQGKYYTPPTKVHCHHHLLLLLHPPPSYDNLQGGETNVSRAEWTNEPYRRTLGGGRDGRCIGQKQLVEGVQKDHYIILIHNTPDSDKLLSATHENGRPSSLQDPLLMVVEEDDQNLIPSGRTKS